MSSHSKPSTELVISVHQIIREIIQKKDDYRILHDIKVHVFYVFYLIQIFYYLVCLKGKISLVIMLVVLVGQRLIVLQQVINSSVNIKIRIFTKRARHVVSLCKELVFGNDLFLSNWMVQKGEVYKHLNKDQHHMFCLSSVIVVQKAIQQIQSHE